MKLLNFKTGFRGKANRKDIGKISKVLIEGDSKKSDSAWMGRNSQNKVVVFPKQELAL